MSWSFGWSSTWKSFPGSNNLRYLLPQNNIAMSSLLFSISYFFSVELDFSSWSDMFLWFNYVILAVVLVNLQFALLKKKRNKSTRRLKRRKQVCTNNKNCRIFGIQLFSFNSCSSSLFSGWKYVLDGWNFLICFFFLEALFREEASNRTYLVVERLKPHGCNQFTGELYYIGRVFKIKKDFNKMVKRATLKALTRNLWILKMKNHSHPRWKLIYILKYIQYPEKWEDSI